MHSKVYDDNIRFTRETISITFTMPNTKGYYPFVCTFPGHSETMQGVIRVN